MRRFASAATLLGMLTGIGGGMVRDVLVREIPTVLRTELYAVAALIGAAAVVIGRMLHLPSAAADTAGAVLCFGLRFMAMRFGWHLPIAHPLSQSDRDAHRSNGDECRRRAGERLPAANRYIHVLWIELH